MNDSPVDCQNREWTEPQRDLLPPFFIRDDVGIVPYKSYLTSEEICRGRRLRRPVLSTQTKKDTHTGVLFIFFPTIRRWCNSIRLPYDIR